VEADVSAAEVAEVVGPGQIRRLRRLDDGPAAPRAPGAGVTPAIEALVAGGRLGFLCGSWTEPWGRRAAGARARSRARVAAAGRGVRCRLCSATRPRTVVDGIDLRPVRLLRPAASARSRR